MEFETGAKYSRSAAIGRTTGTRTMVLRTKSRTKPYRHKNDHKKNYLWCVFLAVLTLYGALWISTSLRIDVATPQLQLNQASLQQPNGTNNSNDGVLQVPTPSSRIVSRVVEQPHPNHGNHNPDANSPDRRGEPDDDEDHNTHNQQQQQQQHKPLFVTYRLELNNPYTVTYGQHTRCWVGVETNKWGRKPIRRATLSKPLSDVLNVTAVLRTNLKIISVGDSVGMQFHEVLEEALRPPNTNNNNNTTATTTTTTNTSLDSSNYRTVYQNAWGDHESVSVAAPVHGGGALAALRMTGLLLEEGRGKPPPNEGPNQTTAAGGWLPEHVRQILDHTYYSATTTTTTIDGGSDHGNGNSDSEPPPTTRTTTAMKRIESFDAMIFRIPHGWLPASSITRERLEASLRMAQELFGVRTVIIQSLFLNNNVKTMEDFTEMHTTNQMISELVEASWKNPDLPDLLFMDFGGWTDQLMELNARLAGMDTRSNANYTLERLSGAKFPPSIAMSCAKAVKPGSPKCTRNVISRDGMHWCMETIGGRIIAGFACLLQCSLSVVEDDKKSHFSSCQQRCNEQFMSLRKVSSLISTPVATTPL